MSHREMESSFQGKENTQDCNPHNAIILAAGCGLRMIPINRNLPTGLIEVRGERLIERIIRQLHEKGIHCITVVVGHMQENYYYLAKEYDVSIVYNPDYALKDSLYSLVRVSERIRNTYIVPSNVYFHKNPFQKKELYSWYLLSKHKEGKGWLTLNENGVIVPSSKDKGAYFPIGLGYITAQDAPALCKCLHKRCHEQGTENEQWEESLLFEPKIKLYAHLIGEQQAISINTYEDLRAIEKDSNYLKSIEIDTISQVFNVPFDQIKKITVLKKGMTNRSFLFNINKEQYIMRVPGEGTSQLIDRTQEAEVYSLISKYKISDDVIYIDPKRGYKITKYIPEAHVCDPYNEEDLCLAMQLLRDFHSLNLKANHRFDLFSKLEFYESLWEGRKSIYDDYEETKAKIYTLKNFIDRTKKEECLSHIDSVQDNFLIYSKENKTYVKLIDWEYAAMQDPTIDIAMFAIYALYKRKDIDHLIDIYYENKTSEENRQLIYAYIAVSGLVWSNWCEYKRQQGLQLGAYATEQYHYAKQFYNILAEEGCI